ncbi:velvet factor [Gorgonomyces haynaldii]|nr:velvet factor [Gorgonomyces haynaldii]
MEDNATATIDGLPFQLRVRQQPLQARMSGFSPKDRRPLDPTPIVELVPLEGQLNDFTNLVVQATLSNVDCTPYISTTHNNMTGCPIATCNYLLDDQGNKGYFFCFADLAICTQGEYRLQFHLFSLRRPKVLASLYSDIFIVYSPKSFPGMKESTPLMRSLARQGERVRMRSGRD